VEDAVIPLPQVKPEVSTIACEHKGRNAHSKGMFMVQFCKQRARQAAAGNRIHINRLRVRPATRRLQRSCGRFRAHLADEDGE